MTIKDEGSAPIGEGQESGKKIDDNAALMERLEKLEATNKRLLEESKGFKEKYKSVTSQVEEKEQKQALEKGDLAKLLDLERNRTQSLTAESNKLRESVLKSTIRQTVAKYAVDVHDIDDLLNQPNFSHILKESLDVEALTVDEEKVSEYVKEVLKAKPYMKKNQNMPGVVTKKPYVNGVQNKTATQMNEQELIEAWKNLP